MTKGKAGHGQAERVETIEHRYQAILGSTRFLQFAQTAHDLRHRTRLESTRSLMPESVGGHGTSAGSDHELIGLATDLHRWLGDIDSARLADLDLLTSLTIDSGRIAR